MFDIVIVFNNLLIGLINLLVILIVVDLVWLYFIDIKVIDIVRFFGIFWILIFNVSDKLLVIFLLVNFILIVRFFGKLCKVMVIMNS